MEKALLDPATVRAYIRLHKKLAIPFKITLSTYTTKIESNYKRIHFMKSFQGNRLFAAYAMLKKQVTRKPVEKINPQVLTYFTSRNFKTDFYADRIYNIDLKAAYASILYTDKFINRKLYTYLMKLPKQERLAAVGMLAGKKTSYEVDLFGTITNRQTVISETADYFFYCVKRTSQLIQIAREILGDDYIFSWVDGIYFLGQGDGKEVAKPVIELFKSYGIKCTFETLTDFHVQIKPTCYHCTYSKGEKRKFINVPKIDTEFTKKLTDYLTLKDYEY